MNNSSTPHKVIIFAAGVFLGCILTIIGFQIPWDRIIHKDDSDIARVQPAIDLFNNFNISLNDRIKTKIQYYVRPAVKMDLIAIYQRSGRYMSMIRDIFEEYNLPQALVFLPIIESGFLPENTSRAGAAGLWQIMPTTASDYGLKYNSWIDERRDPEKSTIVAAEFLRFLYEEFKNWDLALAAYNMGYSDLKRTMQRERIANYWELKSIPIETYNFVPSFYAILHILANPNKYDMNLPDISKPLEYETIELEATFSLNEIARLANVSPTILKNYNPAIISDIAPSGQYTIRVPVGVKEQFLEHAKTNPPERIEFTYMTYRVRRGDTLYKIAQKFGTTMNAIKAENNLRSMRRIKVGQVLRVAIVTVSEESQAAAPDANVPGESDTAKRLNQIKFVYTVARDSFSINILARYYAVTPDELFAWNPWLRTAQLQKGNQVVIYKPANKITMHRTKRGDSLWQLAREYTTTVAHIKMWNQLPNSRIHPGQRLIVKLI